MKIKLPVSVLYLSLALTTFGAERGALNNVPEAANYDLVYSLDIPDAPNYSAGVTYDIDLHNYLSDFTRIAYYLELQTNGGPLNYLWVSMDAFTADITQIGVPTVPSGALFQQPVANMDVVSDVAGIVTGTNLDGGNIEFWPYNYSSGNSAGVPNASDTTFDWGDTAGSDGNYGSMQVANAAASQMLISFNRWGGYGGVVDLGIGNDPTGNPDWTFAQNAAGYTVKTLQVFVLPTSNNNPPVLVGADGETGLTNVVLSFSKALEDAATNISHYALNGGLSVLQAALDPATRLSVTLTTSPQMPLSNYTVTVNGVRDATPAHLTIAANSTATFRSSIAGRGATNNIPEAASYTLVYSLDIPDSANYANGLTYTIDNRAGVSGFSRIAYYLELQESGKNLNFLWVSMDAFTTNVNQIGVPTVPSGALFQQPVANMDVFSSDADIVTGTNLAGGNLKFWPSNYASTNSAGVPNASDTLYDWGDQPTPGGYGSMQVANAAASQMLISFNNWGGNGGTVDLGIGNDPNGNPDWTFAGNASGYAVKTLQVYALPIYDTNRPVILSATGVGGLTEVVLAFSKPLDDSATNLTYYAVSGGLTVLGAALDPLTKASVILTTTLQQPLTSYTVTVNGVFERNGFHTPIAPNSTITFTSSPQRGTAYNVPEAANYALVYSLDIPNTPNYAGGVTYDIDLHTYFSDFTRIAYYLELQTSTGPLNYLWVSMDAFTTDTTQIGVPTVPSGALFQQPVANMDVFSDVTGIVTGTNLDGGNLQVLALQLRGRQFGRRAQCE